MIRKKIKEKNQKRFGKVLIFLLVVLFIAVFLFLPNVAFAAEESVQNEVYINWISDVIKIVSHVVYVFIWPCLTIAGAALDNSLIYGSILHLDAALWNIWNIMKNFANFTLWFIFIFTIVKNLFAWSLGKSDGDPIKGAKDTIVQTLIAWVLVQMSWFIVAALIDLSTILIYAVWWIPLSMLWSYNQDVSDIPIMRLNTEFDGSDISYYYSYWDYNFSPCLLANKEWDVDENILLQPELTWEYIVWRKFLYMPNGEEFSEWYCVLHWYLYKYNESTWFRQGTDFFSGYQVSGDTVSEKNNLYLKQLNSYFDGSKGQTWYLFEQRNSCSLVRAYNKEYTWSDDGKCQELCPGYWEISYTGDVFSGTENRFTLADLMENSKWWVWPFVTMYSSILRYQDLVIDPWNYTAVWNFFGLLLNTFFAVALFIPIAILMVLLIVRIGYLWLVVAISPILILVNFGPLKNNESLKKIFNKFGPKEIIRLIFAPVVVVFTVSLCIVFLATIFRSKPNHDNEAMTLSAFWIEKVSDAPAEWDSGGEWQNSCNQWWEKKVNKETYSILWVATVTLEAQNYNRWLSMFAWVLLELLATAMVWFFMKFAIWVMWEKWKKLMESAGEFVGSIPVVPLPGGHWTVWFNKIWAIWPTKLLDSVSSEMNNKSYEILKNKFPWAYGIDDKDKNKNESLSKAVNEVRTYIEKNPSVTFATLPAEHKETLAKLYWEETLSEWNYDAFVDYNKSYTSVIKAGESVNTSPTTAKTNADAVLFTREQMNRALLSDLNWKAWARGMVGWSVELFDGVFMVDYIDWTQRTGNPQYQIRTREDYEKQHFGNPIQSLSVNEYNAMEKDKQDALKKHFTELQEEIEQLEAINQKINNNQDLSDTEKNQQKSFEDVTNGIATLTKDMIDQKMKDLGIQ